MPRGSRRLFAGRRISLSGVAVTLAVIVVGFGIGIGAGWATSLFADSLSSPSPSSSPSASPSPSATPTMDVSLPPMAPVTRTIDDDDRAAGLRSLDFPVRGDGTFATAPAPTATTPDAGVVRYVRIDIENGLEVTDSLFASFVMAALNDPQAWGREGPTTYVQTEGAPDVRVVLASPYTAAALCPTPHEPAALTPETTATPSPSPTPSAAACAGQGAIVVSVYDWIQGLEPFAEDRTDSRIYQLNHGMGHVDGKADTTCKKGVADVMVDQRTLPKACTPNPWPFPAKD